MNNSSKRLFWRIGLSVALLVVALLLPSTAAARPEPCPEVWFPCTQGICDSCCVEWGGSGGICAGGGSCFCWY